jgi:RNA polymerase sigma factor (sigma-70 family)
LTKEGFDRLLAVLDPDRELAGFHYEQLRKKLINYFDWRDCPYPEEHADEAINRVIRKLADGEQFRDIGTYIFGIARMMLLEIARAKEKERTIFERVPIAQPDDEETLETDSRVHCLKECLAALTERSREMIVSYYQGERSAKVKRRKELATKLGLQPNALRIRACRLRAKLEECMGRCLNQQEQE